MHLQLTRQEFQHGNAYSGTRGYGYGFPDFLLLSGVYSTDDPPGPSGLDFVHAALREGYKLTLHLRNAAKLPAEVKDNALVTVIEGELNDEAGLEKAASC